MKQLSIVRLYNQDSDLSKFRLSYLNRGVNYNTNLLTWLDCLGLASSMADMLKAVREQTYKIHINGVEGSQFFDGWTLEEKDNAETGDGFLNVFISKKITVS